MAADDQAGRTGDRRADLVPGPGRLDLLQHRVDALAAAAQLDPTRLVIVLARAEADAEREATAGERVDAQRLLCERTALVRSGASRTVVERPIRSVTAAAAASAVSGS